MALEIRRFEPDDFDAVIELHRRGLEQTGADMGPGPWDDDLASVEALLATYIASGGEFAVGLLEASVVAMGALRPAGHRRGEIKRMRVQIDLQRRGFGQGILAHLESRARELGMETLFLDTTTLQAAALALYRENGYVETGRSREGVFEVVTFETSLL